MVDFQILDSPPPIFLKRKINLQISYVCFQFGDTLSNGLHESGWSTLEKIISREPSSFATFFLQFLAAHVNDILYYSMSI